MNNACNYTYHYLVHNGKEHVIAVLHTDEHYYSIQQNILHGIRHITRQARTLRLEALSEVRRPSDRYSVGK